MQGRSLITLVVAFLISTNIQASLNDRYYPKSFQDSVQSGKLKNSELKEQLFNIIAGIHDTTHKTDKIVKKCPESSTCFTQERNISYKQARKFLFGKLHLQKNRGEYFIKDVYCQKEFGSEFGVGPNKIPNSNHLNCEHTWPQSRFSPKFPSLVQKNDLHHLYPTDSRANSSRSNHIFAIVNGRAVNNTCQSSRRGMAIGSSLTAFEPPENHRGNVARALFYFSVRYKIQIDPLEESYLREWHRDDPVDSTEIKRNNEIFKIQKNRNPFIDEPLLVDDIRDF